MKRREFISLLGGAAAWPLGARAQQPNRMRRIGWMDSFRETDSNAQARLKAFHEVMDKLGWTVGRNLTIDYRWGLFELERARLAGAELLALAPDVMLCRGTPSALAMKGATRTVPAAAARKIAVEPVAALVHDLADVEQIMTRLGRELGTGIIFSPDAFLYANRALIIELAARHRLPAIYGLPGTAAEGGLIYYVVDIVDLSRKAASYIDRILRGEKPGDLPVQHPTKFDMTINLKTATALGLTVPNTLLVSADEVIE